MECDVVLNIGDGNNSIKINKEDSSLELNSLLDIIKFLYDHYKTKDLQDLFKTLKYAKANISKEDKVFNGAEVIGNCSLELLLYTYPKETELLSKIPEKRAYSLTLIDRGVSNGEAFRGRIVSATGKVSYVIRNRSDAEFFAKNEYKKYLVEQLLKDDEILDSYLSEKYLKKLLIIRDHYKNNIKNISKEVDPNFNKDSKFTIKYLLLDYLNNHSKYLDLIELKESIIDARSILNDFCREMNHLQVFNEDSESNLARTLRSINYDRSEYGKKELYEVLIKYIPELKQEYSEEDFVDLSTKDLEILMLKCFKDDIILRDYHVIGSDVTKKGPVVYPKDKIRSIFNKLVKDINKERKELGLLELSEDMDKVITTEEEAKEFFKNHLFVEINGIKYPLSIRTRGKSLLYYYTAKKLTNLEKIFFKRSGKSLKDEFGFTLDTKKIFEPVNEEGVNNGYYNGYYIYKHADLNTKDYTYIISRSIINPDLFGFGKFKSLRDAKLAVLGYIRSANIKKASDININLNVQHSDGTRYATIYHTVSVGQTLNIINYPINPRIKLPTQEYQLYNKKIHDVLEYYKQFGIDLTKLTLPEQYGLFLYKMVEKLYNIHYLLKNKLTSELLSEIEEIINDISTRDRVQYLVERVHIKKLDEFGREYEEIYDSTKSKDSKDTQYIVYLKDLTNSGRVINSAGVNVKDGTAPRDSINACLYNLKTSLENTIFKDTPISIEVVTNKDLLDMKDDKENSLFPNGVDDIRAFIHNNKIYLNQNKADINDMLHETFHILLGAIKVKDFDTYVKILQRTEKYVSKTTKNNVKKIYGGLAELDILEEEVVRYLARTVENGRLFLYENKTDDAITYIAKLFENMNNTIREAIKKDFNSDLGFTSILNILVKDNISEIKRNRIVTNLIKKGISDGTIIQDCV